VVDKADGEKYLRTVETSVRTSRHNFKNYDYKYDVEKRLKYARQLLDKGQNAPAVARQISIAEDKAVLIAEFAGFTQELARRASLYAKRVDTKISKAVAKDLDDMADDMAKLAKESDEDSQKALIFYERKFGDSTPMMLAAFENPPTDPEFLLTRQFTKVGPAAYEQAQGKKGSAAIIGAASGGTVIALTAAGTGAVVVAAATTKSGSGKSGSKTTTADGVSPIGIPDGDDGDGDGNGGDGASDFIGSWNGSGQLMILGVPTESQVNADISQNGDNYTVDITIDAGGKISKSFSGADGDPGDSKHLVVGGFDGTLSGSTVHAKLNFSNPSVQGSLDLN